jgi:ubiquinol oxidase
VIHLFESFGWWRASELRKVHFAEEWNELHHLLIMESLGGNTQWKDRFFAYHSVIVYYWALVGLYIFRP